MRNQYWNHRLPQNQPRTKQELRQHLLANRRITANGCWEWTGMVSKSGYGKIKWRPIGDLRVHRLAAHLWMDFDLKDGRRICHRCDNPPCFNPEHLFKGTDKENQIDSVKKHRHWLARKTMCKHGHKFSPENTYTTKLGARQCRKCHVINVTAARRR